MSLPTFDIGGLDIAGRLGQALGTGLKEGYSKSVENRQKLQLEREKQQSKQASPEQAQALTHQLIQSGMDPQIAQLIPLLTTGGQTKAAEFGLEGIFRGEGQQDAQQGLGQTQEEAPEIENQINRNFAGRTPRERVKREDDLLKANEPKLQETAKKTQALTTERFRIERLGELNKTGKLPKGAQRFNVNLETGELRLPFAASPESQEFVKIINDFTTGAKDTFGARVTNFELQRFMKRLPSLLNTEEGRERVLRQMEILNELNQVHNQGINSLFDQYGDDKFSFSQASRHAERINRDRIDQLRNEYTGLDQAMEAQAAPKAAGGGVFMIDPSGQRRSVPKNQVKKAQEAGYKLER